MNNFMVFKDAYLGVSYQFQEFYKTKAPHRNPVYFF